jgi:hexosaminidase
MEQSYLFLPTPRRIAYREGSYLLPEDLLVLLDGPQPQELRFAASRFQSALEKAAGLHWQQTASRAVPAEQVGLTLRIAPERAPMPQGYRLHITPGGLLIEGHDPAGVFYGVCSLVQLLEQAGSELPCLEVQDWPDIPNRGVMLDISRDRVYTMEYLYDLVDRLAGWKINEVQLYTEHTFAYRNHRMVWEKASPMTGEEIMALDAYCRERFIELVPNQNSFGHMERWLIYPQYADLAETHDEFQTPWGNTMKGPFSLAPEHPGSLPLVTGLYDDLLPHFTSKIFNVGCDETIDLGQGVSKELCAERGTGRVYLDFLLKVYADLSRRGYTMQFWGDIIVQHPELVPELPRDVIALSWGYEDIHPFNKEGEQFAASGVPFYVCPGTSSWCSLGGRTENTLSNLLNAAENGIKHGAIGFLNTDWGDRGHWQVPPVSYLGFAAGAAYSWALEANRDVDIAPVLSRFAFEDPTGTMGRVAYDLGNVFRLPGLKIPNGSALFWSLQVPLQAAHYVMPSPEVLQTALDEIDAAVALLPNAKMARPDADLIRREFLNTARIMRHGARRIQLALNGRDDKLCAELTADMEGFLEEYRELWLARSRPGGLADSTARFEAAMADYQ